MLQVALHWTILVLVAFQFVAHDAMDAAFAALRRGEEPRVADSAMTYLHVVVGSIVLVLMTLRLYLRLSRGVPAPPADEPWPLQFAASAVHVAIYVLLFLLPLTGAVAWFMGLEPSAELHELLTTVLLLAIAAHVGGALFQHFFRRSDVMMRMLEPQKEPRERRRPGILEGDGEKPDGGRDRD